MPRAAARRATATAIALAALLPALAGAGWRDDVGGARVIGEGDLRKWGLLVYHARLWGERAAPAAADPLPADALAADRPFALELVYHRAIRRDRIVDVSIEEMQRLQGAALTPQRREQWRRALTQALVDVDAGDRLTGVFLPAHGMRLYRGDQMLADIADPDFARAFFSIWLDPRTSEADLRTRLLGARG